MVHVSVAELLVASPESVPTPVHSLEPLDGNSKDMNPEWIDPGPANALIAPTQRVAAASTVFHDPSRQSAV